MQVAINKSKLGQEMHELAARRAAKKKGGVALPADALSRAGAKCRSIGSDPQRCAILRILKPDWARESFVNAAASA